MLKEFELSEYVRGSQGSPDVRQQRLPLNAEEQITDEAIDIAGVALVRTSLQREALLKKSRVGSITAEENNELNEAEALLRSANVEFSNQLVAIRGAVANLQKGESWWPWAGAKQTVPTSQLKAILEEGSPVAFQSLLADRARQTGKSEAILQTVVLPERIHLLLTTPTVQKAFTVAIQQPSLNRLIARFRNAIQDGEDPLVAGKSLHDLIFAPIRAVLEEAKIETIALSPDLGLSYVPFGALYDGTQYLIERFNFVVLTDPTYVRLVDSGRDWQIASFGVSEGAVGMNPLPAVSAELEGIAQVAGIRALKPKLNSEFTREELIKAIGRYEVIHLASHFVASTDERTSFLLLGGNGKLSAEEIRKLRFSKTELLTLSACDTAIPVKATDNSRIDALARSTQAIGGARTVVATLWEISDISTAVFMRRFYELLLADPSLNKSDALVHVQREFLAGGVHLPETSEAPALTTAFRSAANGLTRGRMGTERNAEAVRSEFILLWRHPRYWAPFLMFGNWS
jgi:CHAT domain-containing protein